MSRLSRFLALVAVLSLGLAAAPAVALASPDAKVDQQIRPCFGLLLEPNLSKGCRTTSRPKVRPCPRGTFRVRGRCESAQPVVRRDIDCDYAYPGQVSDTLARLYEGDVLTLTSTRGGACVETLNITQSVTIVVRNYTPSRDAPILIAPSGQPCIRIAPGVQYVVLEGLGIEAVRAGQASCITGRATELALKGVTIRYAGEGSAMDVTDSRIELQDTVFIGRTRQPVVKATGEIMASNVEIAATAIGAALETSGDSRMRDIRVTRLGDWTGSARTRNSAGFVIAGMNRQQLVKIESLYVDGFSRGIYVAGGDETTLLNPVVRDSDWAVVLENTNLQIRGGDLEALDVGIYAASGIVFASNNRIHRVMRSGIYADAGGQVRSVDNRVFARPGGCEALVTGHFSGELTCRPWFEAPEVFRTPRDQARLDFDSYWPAPAFMPASASPVPPQLPQDALAGAPQAGGAPR